MGNHMGCVRLDWFRNVWYNLNLHERANLTVFPLITCFVLVALAGILSTWSPWRAKVSQLEFTKHEATMVHHRSLQHWLSLTILSIPDDFSVLDDNFSGVFDTTPVPCDEEFVDETYHQGFLQQTNRPLTLYGIPLNPNRSPKKRPPKANRADASPKCHPKRNRLQINGKQAQKQAKEKSPSPTQMKTHPRKKPPNPTIIRTKTGIIRTKPPRNRGFHREKLAS